MELQLVSTVDAGDHVVALCDVMAHFVSGGRSGGDGGGSEGGADSAVEVDALTTGLLRAEGYL